MCPGALHLLTEMGLEGFVLWVLSFPFPEPWDEFFLLVLPQLIVLYVLVLEKVKAVYKDMYTIIHRYKLEKNIEEAKENK